MRLGAEVEDVGPIGGQFAQQEVDRSLVRQVGEMDRMLPRSAPMLFRAPLDVARTNACTFAPSATSASVRCEPMKPSAPVTRAVRPA